MPSPPSKRPTKSPAPRGANLSRRGPVNVSALTLLSPKAPPDMNDPTRPDPTAGVRAGYDRWAAVYDHDANPLQALEEPFFQSLAGDARGRSALDLGCGTGR